jgi:hypothetical protein
MFAMNSTIIKILIVFIFFVFIKCSNSENEQKNGHEPVKMSMGVCDSILHPETKKPDTSYIKEQVLKQVDYVFPRKLSATKVKDIFKMHGKDFPKGTRYIMCEKFDFKNFQPIKPVIYDPKKYLTKYCPDPEAITEIGISQGIFSNLRFFVSEGNGYRRMALSHLIQQKYPSDSYLEWLDGFVFKELSGKYYFHIYYEGIGCLRTLHSITLLNDSLYPVKRICRRFYFNEHGGFFNTDFIYKDGKLVCEISKPTGDFKLNEKTTFGDVFKLFRTKVDVKNIRVLISDAVEGDKSFPYWMFCLYSIIDSSLVIH